VGKTSLSVRLADLRNGDSSLRFGSGESDSLMMFDVRRFGRLTFSVVSGSNWRFIVSLSSGLSHTSAQSFPIL